MNKHIFKTIQDMNGSVGLQWNEEDKQEFAELIVRECARVARATPTPNFHEHLKKQLGHQWDMAAAEAGREIVKHFGLEGGAR